MKIVRCVTKFRAKFRSCRLNRKGRRGNQIYRVSSLDDVGQATQPISIHCKTLCVDAVLWHCAFEQCSQLAPVITMNFMFCTAYLITVQSIMKIIDLVYYQQRLSLLRNKLEPNYSESEFSCGQ